MSRKLFAIVLFFSTLSAMGQFYSDGVGNIKLKWKQIDAKEYKLLYPDYYQPTALKFSGYMDSIIPYVRYGMVKQNRKLPIILETQNQYSNGMVVWSPKREELVVTPPSETYAMPWFKQLAVHEYRHVTQISNMRAGLTRIASWVLGENGVVLAMPFMPKWAMEGDATNTETQAAPFGRGMQPSFSIGYRAMMYETDFNKYTQDNLLCGSYKKYYPNIYEYGYFVSRGFETFTKDDVWGDLFLYVGRWPILIFPVDVYLKSNFKITSGKISKRTFKELGILWKPFSEVPNSYSTISKPSRSHTTYATPLSVGEDRVVVQKMDFDNPNYFILREKDGQEKRIVQLGTISSRPIWDGQFLYWTEYKPGMIYEKQNYSVVKRIDVNGKSAKTYCSKESNYFVTPIKNGFATVKYDTLTNGYIQIYDKNFHKKTKINIADFNSLHGLAWDQDYETLYFIALGQNGMWIGQVKANGDELKVVRDPSAVTMRDLKAKNGKLYFGSIASGKDEIHCLDIQSGVETRLTTSRFGVKEEDVDDQNLYAVTYNSKGWLLAKQPLDSLLSDTVKWRNLPQSKLNFDFAQRRVDKKNVESIELADTTTKHKIKKYSRFTHMFNFHSWMPIPDIVFNERAVNATFGATGYFQSSLSDMAGSLTLGSMYGDFWGALNFTYSGLPVKFSLRAEYGGGAELVYGANLANEPITGLRQYFAIGGRANLPLKFSSGAINRMLNAGVGVTHYQARVYNQNGYKNGYQRWDASLYWSEYNRTSHRAVGPRLGYALQVGVSGAFQNNFSVMWTALATGYFPGFMKNHAVKLTAAFQTQNYANYMSYGNTLQVRGVFDQNVAKNYYAATLDYTFPVWCPDWGIPSVIYFKRISLNVFADYSFGNYFENTIVKNKNYCAAGFDLLIDFSLVRSFPQSIRFGFAFPKNRPMYFSVGYNLGF